MGIAIWKARLIKNNVSAGTINVLMPSSGETITYYSQRGDNGSIFNAMQSIFGGTVTMFYRSNVYPTNPYAQESLMGNLYPGPILNGIDIKDIALNDVWDFRFEETAPMGVRMTVTNAAVHPTVVNFSYYRGSETIFSINGATIGDAYFNTPWGEYHGNFYGDPCIPLPSFPSLKMQSFHTSCGNVYVYNSTSMETTVTRYSNDSQNTFTNIDVNKVSQWLGTYVPKIPDPYDPYDYMDPSGPSGPADASGIPENDPIDIPDVPTVSASDTGFVTLFNPTLSQVKDLADYMWTGLFDLATYKKIFADPMDCLLGFNMLPVAIPHGSAVAVRVGNISTGISMNPATSQWVEVDCGSINVGDAFGNYLSYAPYTKFSMYLPYIGIVELSADDVVGKTVTLKYHVDVLSCSCVAYLKCGDSVLYQFTGSCGYSIPVSSNDFRATIANIVSITATVAGAVVTGGAAAGVTAGTTAKAAAKAARMKAAQSAAAIGDAASISKNVMGSKPEVHRSGAIGGSAGIMGMQKPYLIVEYPNPCKPAKQYHYTGYPSFVTVKLNDISGYAEFEEILIEGVPCTEAEQAMIKNLCKEGIFL